MVRSYGLSPDEELQLIGYAPAFAWSTLQDPSEKGPHEPLPQRTVLSHNTYHGNNGNGLNNPLETVGARFRIAPKSCTRRAGHSLRYLEITTIDATCRPAACRPELTQTDDIFPLRMGSAVLLLELLYQYFVVMSEHYCAFFV